MYFDGILYPFVSDHPDPGIWWACCSSSWAALAGNTPLEGSRLPDGAGPVPDLRRVQTCLPQHGRRMGRPIAYPCSKKLKSYSWNIECNVMRMQMQMQWNVCMCYIYFLLCYIITLRNLTVSYGKAACSGISSINGQIFKETPGLLSFRIQHLLRSHVLFG